MALGHWVLGTDDQKIGLLLPRNVIQSLGRMTTGDSGCNPSSGCGQELGRRIQATLREMSAVIVNLAGLLGSHPPIGERRSSGQPKGFYHVHKEKLHVL